MKILPLITGVVVLIPCAAYSSGIVSSLASTAAHTAVATAASMETAHAIQKRGDNSDTTAASEASVCGKFLVTRSVAKQIAPFVDQSPSHIIVRVSQDEQAPDGTHQCEGSVTYPGGSRNASWTAQKHAFLYKVAATLR
jgi:Tfp pilus assembly protein PilE